MSGRLAALGFALCLGGCAVPGDGRQLGEPDFARVQVGMSRDDTLRLLGKPYDTWTFPRQQTGAWDYLHVDAWGYNALFSVIFGAEGKVTGTLVQRVNDGGDYGQ
jgi:outer membrane protein assembly factor BamE (lipoprotein component of BamABCDE complex)